MVDVTFQPNRVAQPRTARKRGSLRTALKRKSTMAFLMTLPLILLIALLVIYPAFYSLHLATLNKSMQRFIGLGNFQFLFKRETFWLVVQQSCIFALTAVFFKALIGFIVAHFVHNIPAKGQRKWRGMLLVPWVIPPAMSTLAWLWLFDPSYSAFNYLLAGFGVDRIPWTGAARWITRISSRPGHSGSASRAAISRSAPAFRCSWCRFLLSRRSSSCAISTNAGTKPDDKHNSD